MATSSRSSNLDKRLSLQEPLQAIPRRRPPCSDSSRDQESDEGFASDLSTSGDSFALEPCDYLSDDLDNDENPISCFRIPQLTAEEKNRLIFGIKRFGPGNTDKICQLLPERNVLQIMNYISTLHCQSAKPKKEPLRFGYPSNEDDCLTSSTQSSETISECNSSDTAFDVPQERLEYDRSLNSIINWTNAQKRFNLPDDESLEIVSVQVLHYLLNYIRELIRLVSSISSANPLILNQGPIHRAAVTNDMVMMALNQMKVLFQKEGSSCPQLNARKKYKKAPVEIN